MKKLNRVLVIACGPDHAGKTKLCNHLIEKYRFNYYHCGVQADIKQYHTDVYNLTINDIQKYNSNFIIDRMHLSEEVYGNIFRNGPAYDWKSFNDKLVSECKEANIRYELILCLPPKDIVVKGHAERNAAGNEMFNTVDPVYDSYVKLYEENRNLMHKYDFTVDPDYSALDQYLEEE